MLVPINSIEYLARMVAVNYKQLNEYVMNTAIRFLDSISNDSILAIFDIEESSWEIRYNPEFNEPYIIIEYPVSNYRDYFDFPARYLYTHGWDKKAKVNDLAIVLDEIAKKKEQEKARMEYEAFEMFW